MFGSCQVTTFHSSFTVQWYVRHLSISLTNGTIALRVYSVLVGSSLIGWLVGLNMNPDTTTSDFVVSALPTKNRYNKYLILIRLSETHRTICRSYMSVIIYNNIQWKSYCRFRVMLFNATSNNISAILWLSVLFVGIGISQENHGPSACQTTLSQNVVSCTRIILYKNML